MSSGQDVIRWVQSWDEYRDKFVQEVHVYPSGDGTYTMTIVSRDKTESEKEQT